MGKNPRPSLIIAGVLVALALLYFCEWKGSYRAYSPAVSVLLQGNDRSRAIKTGSLELLNWPVSPWDVRPFRRGCGKGGLGLGDSYFHAWLDPVQGTLGPRIPGGSRGRFDKTGPHTFRELPYDGDSVADWRFFDEGPTQPLSAFKVQFVGFSIPLLGFNVSLLGGNGKPIVIWRHWGRYRVFYEHRGGRRLLVERTLINSDALPGPYEMGTIDPCGEYLACSNALESYESEYWLWLFAMPGRDVEHQARVAELRARFVDGPVLIVPRPTSSAIDTLGSTPIPDIGLVIMEYRATPAWGSLTATRGVLVPTQGGVLHLTTPFQTNGSTLSGEGWTITLAAGWTVRPGKRTGDFEVVKAGN